MLFLKAGETLQQLGDMLTGYAALVASVYAAVKLTQEYADWRTRKDDEKAAEIAGQTIGASIRFGNALRGQASSLLFYAEYARGPVSAERCLHMFANHMARIQSEHLAFETASELAEAYLPDDAVAAVRDLRSIYKTIDEAWLKHAIFGEPGPGHHPEVVAESLRACAEAKNAILPAVSRLTEVLRRYTVGGHRPR